MPNLPSLVWSNIDLHFGVLVVTILPQFINIAYFLPVWAREEAIDQADYALSIGPDVLKAFEDYFNVTFPLPKQDMVALPDFDAGAMENWGLITYR